MNTIQTEIVTYKVVTTNWHIPTEYFSFDDWGKGCLNYKVGVATVPKFGGIFVFGTFEEAYAFNRFSYGDYKQIFRGIAVNARVLKTAAFQNCDIYAFWEAKRLHKRMTISVVDTPKGTLVCDKFTPIEKVYENDKKTRKLFKVVRKVGQFFLSAISNDLPKTISLQYKIGVKTIPTIGRIFVFDTYDHAYEFFGGKQKYAIMEGEAEDAIYYRYLAENYYSLDAIKTFWKLKREKKKLTEFKEAPTGTLSCSSFLPTKIVRY